MELVFFNASQVLPCYIIRLQDTGLGDDTSHHQPPPLLQKYQESSNAEDDDAKKKQEKLLARVGQLKTLHLLNTLRSHLLGRYCMFF